MESQPWINRVRERLVRQLLPPSYVQRFVEELSDHLEDVKEDGMDHNSSSRLGDPEQVADTAVAAYRRRSFLGRHPVAAFLVFGISPVVSLVVLFFVSMQAFAYLAGFAVGIGIVKQPDHFGVVGSAVVCLSPSAGGSCGRSVAMPSCNWRRRAPSLGCNSLPKCPPQ